MEGTKGGWVMLIVGRDGEGGGGCRGEHGQHVCSTKDCIILTAEEQYQKEC